MATEARAAVRWAIQWLQAFGDLTALIADGTVYKRLPRSADTQAKPGLAVGLQSTTAPTGAIQTGPNTHTEQTCVIRTQVQQEGFSTVAMEAVETLVKLRLDAQYGHPLPGGGEVIECLYLQTFDDLVEPLGDAAQVMTSSMWFRVSLKAA